MPMHEIIVEPDLGAQLGRLPGPAVLCDAAGRALGFFSPLHDRPQVSELQLEPLLSIAETEALRKDQTGKPLSEIFARLGLS